MSAPIESQRAEGFAPSHVRGFRLLDKTDIIAAGDQVLGDDCETWWDIPEVGQGCLGHTWMIGKRYEPGFFQPMRRIDSANTHITQPHEKD
jgi:hypothetical protein